MLATTSKYIAGFIGYQTKGIRMGGTRALLRKGVTLLLLVPAGVLVLVLRGISPISVIRLGAFKSAKFGHFAANTEVYLCERDAGMHGGRRTLDIFYNTPLISNYQLKKMWDRTLHVSRWSLLANLVDWLNRRLPGGKKHVIPWRPDQQRDIHGLLAHTPPHLSFHSGEEHGGELALRNLGIPDGAPFVCFAARDSAYLDTTFPGIDWDYHSYRNCAIRDFMPAVEELVRRGYFAIRMGSLAKPPLDTLNPGIIDYATNGGRTDFLDVYLGAKCRFFLGSSIGLSSIPMIFRRPKAYVNFIPLEHVVARCPDDMVIPKKLWLREEGRFMTFKEILDSGISKLLHTKQYEQRGLDVVDNTAEEIAAVVVEMDERLKGTWRTTEEDEELQEQFRSIFKSSELHGVFCSRIGTEFLRQNRELLL